MELQGVLKGQNDLEKEWSWSARTARLWTYHNATVVKRGGDRVRTQHNGTERGAQEKTLARMVKWFLTKVSRPFNEAKMILSTNGDWKTSCPHIKEWRWILSLYRAEKHIQKWIKRETTDQNRKSRSQSMRREGSDLQLRLEPKSSFPSPWPNQGTGT